MKQNRVNPDIVTFASLADAAAKRGDKEAVEEWMSLISVLAKRGDMQGDEYGLNEMRSKGLKPHHHQHDATEGILDKRKGNKKREREGEGQGERGRGSRRRKSCNSLSLFRN